MSYYTIFHVSFVVLQFIVFKFLNDNGVEPDDESDIYFDVALSKWIITEIDDKMIAKIKWPPVNPSIFVKKEAILKSDWPEKFIKIKRFYGKYYCLFYYTSHILTFFINFEKLKEEIRDF